jgi:hypothetical protein
MPPFPFRDILSPNYSQNKDERTAILPLCAQPQARQEIDRLNKVIKTLLISGMNCKAFVDSHQTLLSSMRILNVFSIVVIQL